MEVAVMLFTSPSFVGQTLGVEKLNALYNQTYQFLIYFPSSHII